MPDPCKTTLIVNLFPVEKRHTLGKNERLKSWKKISALFTGGKRIAVKPLLVHYSIKENKEPGSAEPLQAGVTVSTRNFKKATDRNRIKRLLREAWRLQKQELKNNLTISGRTMDIFIVFTGKEMADYHTISGKMSLVLQKLISETGKDAGR